MATKPLVWMRAVRDATPRFGAARLAVLTMLGLRMNDEGRGYASHATLANDAQMSERTAERATADARRRGYLIRTRRGHRFGDGRSAASEWALTLPESQGVTGDPLTQSQPDTADGLSESQSVTAVGLSESQPDREAPQPVTGVGLRGLRDKRSKQQLAREAVQQFTDATDDEADAVLEAIQNEPRQDPIRHLAAFVRHLGESDDLDHRLKRIRAERAARAEADAYRRGWRCQRCASPNRVDAVRCRQCGERRAA